MATNRLRKKIPLESMRVGVEYDSSADNTVVDFGMEQTTRRIVSTRPESTTSTLGSKLQYCSCDWAEVTSAVGLRIHQGQKKCLKTLEQRP